MAMTAHPLALCLGTFCTVYEVRNAVFGGVATLQPTGQAFPSQKMLHV
uniref:Uncharacterized protein n=1 Tax=Anguilla anguilla TaxID=7936 RepID=A0A0E9SBV3_ANGAN